jgi:hypothetical protein
MRGGRGELPTVTTPFRVRSLRPNLRRSPVGAERTGVDEFEFARRRLTAAAYGFGSWTEFREWRKRNPAAYRERSRHLLEPAHDPSFLVELSAEAPRVRDRPADFDEPADA